MRWLALLLIPACGFGPHATGDGSVIDDRMGAEGPGSEPAPPGCYGNGLGVAVCLATPPTSAVSVTGTRTIVTDTGSPDCAVLTGATMNDYCVVDGTAITISGFLYAHGARPLVLLSLTTIDVQGTIDVASHRNGSPQLVGPGADPSDCGGTQATQATAAGFGGTLGTKGGNGGSTAPPDGVAGDALNPTVLHGGCRGGYGLDMTTNGVGGHGGGVVDLIAEQAISILGTINASGSGGGGAGPSNNGAGGGGSGGMIVFDAPLLTVNSGTTIVFANGGGGGGGSSNSMFSSGSNGGDPGNYNGGGGGGGGAFGVGGPGAPSGGLGGDGASQGHTAGDGFDGFNGGGNGGGGGGLGIIRVFRTAAPTAGHFSPLPG